jgi:hypothetical protein
VVIREHYREPAKETCSALLDHALRQDDRPRQSDDADLIDDKTVFDETVFIFNVTKYPAGIHAVGRRYSSRRHGMENEKVAPGPSLVSAHRRP